VSADDRAAREEKVLEQVREWLPTLGDDGVVAIHVTKVDPDQHDGAAFKVERERAGFVCRRRGGS
jgi:hypothetical protein